MVRSSALKRANLHLRKHRKWPLSPYKAKWHQTLDQQQAKQNVKQSLTTPPTKQQQQIPKQPHILSSLLHSFSIYNCEPPPEAYHFVIKTLAENSQFCDISSVLDHIEKRENFETPEFIFIDLIKTYADAHRFQDSVNLFYKIPKFRINRVGFAIEILNCMINDGFCVDGKTCSLILSSVCEQRDLSSDELLGFVQEMKKLGFCFGMVDYTNVIRSLVKKEKVFDALGILNQMKSDGIKPDIVCYTMVLNGVIVQEDYVKAEELFDELLVLGLVPDVYTYNVYINGLCKQNNVEAGIKMIACMEELGSKPDVITYNTLLQALCKVRELNRLRELVKEMKWKGIVLNLQTYSIMIDGLASKGDIIEACGLLEEALNKGLCTQSSMFDETICGLCQRGLVRKALELLKQMADKDVSPGARVWEALLLSSVSKLDFVNTSFIRLVDQILNTPCKMEG
ncbi:hypothetical protein CISIN_1g039177mg [Citrus sinensis]|uniref:Pentacotripeptide-repeat region of PRORP domain-containing protein n=1 Tax=Citrus sinensis TaxID=2711 RepID=A0A067F7F0_CITSI|nr:hypothetical protein CISIN_1g039177mg [Citrus sinensis]